MEGRARPGCSKPKATWALTQSNLCSAFRRDRSQGCSTAQQGAQASPQAPGASRGASPGAPSTPTTTKSLTRTSNAWPLGFFPAAAPETISLDGTEILACEGDPSPRLSEALHSPGPWSLQLGPAFCLPQSCPFPPSSRFCDISPRMKSSLRPGHAENEPHLGEGRGAAVSDAPRASHFFASMLHSSSPPLPRP